MCTCAHSNTESKDVSHCWWMEQAAYTYETQQAYCPVTWHNQDLMSSCKYKEALCCLILCSFSRLMRLQLHCPTTQYTLDLHFGLCDCSLKSENVRVLLTDFWLASCHMSFSWLWCVCQKHQNFAEERLFHWNALLVSGKLIKNDFMVIKNFA